MIWTRTASYGDIVQRVSDDIVKGSTFVTQRTEMTRIKNQKPPFLKLPINQHNYINHLSPTFFSPLFLCHGAKGGYCGKEFELSESAGSYSDAQVAEALQLADTPQQETVAAADGWERFMEN